MSTDQNIILLLNDLWAKIKTLLTNKTDALDDKLSVIENKSIDTLKISKDINKDTSKIKSVLDGIIQLDELSLSNQKNIISHLKYSHDTLKELDQKVDQLIYDNEQNERHNRRDNSNYNTYNQNHNCHDSKCTNRHDHDCHDHNCRIASQKNIMNGKVSSNDDTLYTTLANNVRELDKKMDMILHKLGTIEPYILSVGAQSMSGTDRKDETRDIPHEPIEVVNKQIEPVVDGLDKSSKLIAEHLNKQIDFISNDADMQNELIAEDLEKINDTDYVPPINNLSGETTAMSTA